MIRARLAHLEEMQVAVMIFTRLPAGRVARVVPMGATAWAWPLVGALVGGVFWAMWAGAQALGLGAATAIVLAMVAGLLATGGLHEDGLADLADGIGGGPDPAKRLEIMRDSRLGSYGAMALIFGFLLGFTLWQEIPAPQMAAVAIATGAISRMALPLWLVSQPQARKEGLGQHARNGLTPLRVALGLGLGGALALALLPPLTALVGILATLGVQGALCLYARGKLGGLTGDVLGAAQVLGHLAALMTLGRV